VSEQFGVVEQTDVFTIDTNGCLEVYWVNSGHWNGPQNVGCGGFMAGTCLAASRQFGLNQTDVFVIDGDRNLNAFWVDNDGTWNGPVVIADSPFIIAQDGCVAASQQFGLNQTDVFTVGVNGQLQVFWIGANGGPWNGPLPIAPLGLSRIPA
jgi:hypothetical protein